MKLIFALFLILSCSQSFADSSINKQFANRNWNYHAALYSRQDHLIDYASVEILEETIRYIRKFVDSLASLDNTSLSLFYPEANILSDNDRIVLQEKFIKAINSYEILQGWESLLAAIGTERWEDPNPANCQQALNPLLSSDCGRRTKGNYAVSNLTNYQLQSLSDFKQIIFDELELIKETDGEMAVGPGPARIFQFLYDSRVVDKLIQQSYVKANDPLTPDLRRTNIIDIGRALIIQMFQGQNGKLVNSDLVEIDLEKDDCFSLPESQRASCQLDYMRFLVWDRNYEAPPGQLVSNLILDAKVIKPFFNALIAKFTHENAEVVTRAQMLEFLERAYFSLCSAYDLNPETLTADQRFINYTISQLKLSADYLINKRNIIGLQVARGLQELIFFIEENR